MLFISITFFQATWAGWGSAWTTEWAWMAWTKLEAQPCTGPATGAIKVLHMASYTFLCCSKLPSPKGACFLKMIKKTMLQIIPSIHQKLCFWKLWSSGWDVSGEPHCADLLEGWELPFLSQASECTRKHQWQDNKPMVTCHIADSSSFP